MLFLPLSAWGCPDCALGRQARAQVFGPDFGQQLLVAALPFACIVVISRFLERRDANRGRAGRTTTRSKS